MALEGLTIIGESINDSVPSTKKLFDAGDLDGQAPAGIEVVLPGDRRSQSIEFLAVPDGTRAQRDQHADGGPQGEAAAHHGCPVALEMNQTPARPNLLPAETTDLGFKYFFKAPAAGGGERPQDRRAPTRFPSGCHQ